MPTAADPNPMTILCRIPQPNIAGGPTLATSLFLWLGWEPRTRAVPILDPSIC
jgi:hypothetical protein